MFQYVQSGFNDPPADRVDRYEDLPVQDLPTHEICLFESTFSKDFGNDGAT